MADYWIPTYMDNMRAWFNDHNASMYGRWLPCPLGPCANEGGVDLASAAGTPVYAIADGTIIGAHDFWHNPPDVLVPQGGNPGYGVVTTVVNVPGYGQQHLYYQHVRINPAIETCVNAGCTGQQVHRGDLIGWIQPGVGELEMGFNARWGPPWQNSSVPEVGPWVTDPRPLLAALLAGGPPAELGGQPTLSGAGLGTGGGLLDFTPLLAAAPALGIKIGIFLLALVLAGFGFYLLFQKQADALVGKSVKVAAKVALA